MGGFSWLARRPAAAGVPTHALFAAQSHSIVDNLVALFEHSRAWNCSNQERALATASTVSAVPMGEQMSTSRIGVPPTKPVGDDEIRSLLDRYRWARRTKVALADANKGFP